MACLRILSQQVIELGFKLVLVSKDSFIPVLDLSQKAGKQSPSFLHPVYGKDHGQLVEAPRGAFYVVLCVGSASSLPELSFPR